MPLGCSQLLGFGHAFGGGALLINERLSISINEREAYWNSLRVPGDQASSVERRSSDPGPGMPGMRGDWVTEKRRLWCQNGTQGSAKLPVTYFSVFNGSFEAI